MSPGTRTVLGSGITGPQSPQQRTGGHLMQPGVPMVLPSYDGVTGTTGAPTSTPSEALPGSWSMTPNVWPSHVIRLEESLVVVSQYPLPFVAANTRPP